MVLSLEAHHSLFLLTKLGEPPFYVRSWNGPSPSLVPFHIGGIMDLQRRLNRHVERNMFSFLVKIWLYQMF